MLFLARKSTLVALTLLALLVGCHGWPGKPAEPIEPRSASFSGVKRLPEGERPVAMTVLSKPDAWSLTPRMAHDEPEPAWRWRHSGMDQLLAAARPEVETFRQAAADPDKVLAVNASIALARLGDPTGQKTLVEAVANPSLGNPTRCAAAEALGRLEGPVVGASLGALIDQFGDVTQRGRASYRGALHRELLAGLARHADPADDPRFLAAVKSPETDVRREAALAWASGKKGSLPEAVVDLTSDPDAPVRAAAMTAVARRGHPDAMRLLSSGTHDTDVMVRRAAIAALGHCGRPEAVKLLTDLSHDRSEAIRAAAVTGLAAAGVEESLVKALQDETWQVRAAGVRGLARFPSSHNETLVRRLVDDRSPLVKKAAIDVTDAWPVAHAGRVLMAAMANPSPDLRRAAAEKLASRWPPAEAFSWRAPPERRADGLAQLAVLFANQFGPAEASEPFEATLAGAVSPTGAPSVGNSTPGMPNAATRNATAVASKPPVVERVDPAAVARAEAALRTLNDSRSAEFDVQRAKETLALLGAALPPALAVSALDKGQAVPEIVYSDLLPRVDAAFVLLDRFGQPDVNERRRAASELARLAAEKPLCRLAAARLVSRMTTETDTLMWLHAFHAMAADASESSLRLARLAIGHPAPEVRRRACVHLAAHPSPAHVPLLLPTLADKDQDVVQAAVAAMVAGGRLDDTRPLVDMLRTSGPNVRVDVAFALAHFGDRSGVDELIRLSQHSDPRIRRRTADAMGQLGDRRFTSALIALLDDQQTIRRVALLALPKVVGHDVPHPADQPPRSATERVTLWKEWHRRGA